MCRLIAHLRTVSGGCDGENRPIRWERGDTVITMDFDRLGRRTFYRETENGQQVTFTRFLYDGYVMIQQVFSNSPYNIYKEFVWDPTESVATKPLCFRQHNQSDAYLMHDGNKNVTDVIAASTAAGSLAHYDYAPFGAVRAQSGSRAAANPYRFSSEFSDDTLGLVYYNYRHYDPTMGRWLSRDPIFDNDGDNESTLGEYCYLSNCVVELYDMLGLKGNLTGPGGYGITWPSKPKPGSGGKGVKGGAGIMLNLVISGLSDYMLSCDGPCVKAGDCMLCCNLATTAAMAAATAAYISDAATCASWGLACPACLAAVGYLYDNTLDSILESQEKCLKGCLDNPL